MTQTITASAFPSRRHARLTGLLFLLPFPLFGIGKGLMDTVLQGSPHVTPEDGGKLVAGALLLLGNSTVVTLLGLMLRAPVEKSHPVMARAYSMSRAAEALLLLLGAVSALCLVSYSASQPSGDAALQEMMSVMAGQTLFWTYQLAMLALALGSVPLCRVLLRTRVAPAWLCWLGLSGYVLLGAGALLECVGMPYGIALSLPGGLFELGMGMWLLVTGGRASRTVKAVRTAAS